MFNLKVTATVFRKEAMEILRDKKTLLTTYGIPLILYPLIAIWGGEALTVQLEKMSKETFQVTVLGEIPRALSDKVSSDAKFKFHALEADDRSQAESLASSINGKDKLRELFARLKVHAALYGKKVTISGEAGPNYQVKVMYDDSETSSVRATEQISKHIQEVATDLRAQRLKSRGLASEFISPLTAEKEPLAGLSHAATKAAGTALAYFIVVLLCLTAYYPALNTTVGERERGTLATLLSCPIRPLDLIGGKFAAVVTASTTGLLAYAASMLACGFFLSRGLPHTEKLPTLWPLILLTFSATFPVSALCMSTGLFARRMTEGQAFLSILMMSLLVPIIVAGATEADLTAITAATPIVNIAVFFKDLSAAGQHLSFLAIACLSNLLVASAILGFATHVLKSEYLSDAPLSELLSFKRDILSKANAGLSFLSFLAMMGIAFYSNFVLSKFSLLAVLTITHLLGMGALPWFLARHFRLDPRATFRLNRPSALGLLGAALLGLGAPFLVLAFFPSQSVPKELEEALTRRLGLDGSHFGWFYAFLTVAVIPPIFEELSFRGLILSGFLRSFSKQWAVFLTAILFGLIHISMIRFFPTLAAGVVFGIIAVETTSIFPAIAAHMAYNGILILASRSAPLIALSNAPGRMLGASLIAIAAGAALLWAGRPGSDRFHNEVSPTSPSGP